MFQLLSQYGDIFPFFNVFRYITFRTAGATLTAMFFVFIFGPPLIEALRQRQGKGQPIREDGPQGHLISKIGTPTMGGLIILLGLVVSTFLWADLANGYMWVIMFVTLGFGSIGFYDDYIKVTCSSHRGFSSKKKFVMEALVAALAAWGLIILAQPDAQATVTGMLSSSVNDGPTDTSTSILFPFLKDLALNLSWFFIIFGAFVITGAGNAVNLTDGLDGLAIVPVMIAAGSFAVIAYLSGNVTFSTYLQISHVYGTSELAVLCGALIGAGLGFLWFNAPPASIFMGDTGSLALGGMIGAIAVATKHELVLVIVGGLFVLEAMSVIIQVISFRLTGRRIFRMAPIHHHFEHLGWTEPQIVIRFWIIAFILALIGLSSLKLR